MQVNNAVKAAWGLDLEVTKAEGLGINNEIYRVGNDFWLTRCPTHGADRLVRESALFDRLNELAVASGSSLRVPEVVLTMAGDPIYREWDFAWRLTRHLPGEILSTKDVESYVGLAEGIAELDLLMAQVPCSMKVWGGLPWLEESASNTRALREAVQAGSLEESEGDIALLDWIVTTIEGALPALDALPKQLIHGDCYPANVKMITGEKPQVIGMLDFEFSSPGPRILELAVIALSFLLRNDLEVARNQYSLLAAAYERRSGTPIDLELLKRAMVVIRFAGYWYHRGRVLRGEIGRDHLDWELQALRKVRAFVDG